MLPVERKRTLVELVSERDGCSVAELADELDVSKPTIRRDLRELEQDHLLERSHGGAVPVSTVGNEPTYGQKEIQNLERKRAIAERAVREIKDGQVVFFDSGTTTMEVAKQARSNASFLAATNSPLLALELGKEGDTVKLTGGTVRQRTRALVGPTAEAFLDRTNFDLLFLGTNGVNVESGLTTPNEDEARMKRLMCEKADRVVLVADETKLAERTFVQFAELSDVDAFVTDTSLPSTYQEAFTQADVDVVEVVE